MMKSFIQNVFRRNFVARMIAPTVALSGLSSTGQATSFEEYEKIDIDKLVTLTRKLATKFRAKIEKQYADRAEAIESYLTEDPFGDVEFDIDLEKEIDVYREWADATSVDLADHSIEDVAVKVVERRFPAQLSGITDGTFIGIREYEYDYKRFIIKNDGGHSEGFVIVHPDRSLKPYFAGSGSLSGRRVRVFWKCDMVS